MNHFMTGILNKCKMDYKKLYNSIVANATLEKRRKKNGVYYEKHHIQPKCLGGTND